MGKRIKDLSRTETDGYLAVDNATNGTGKMNTSVIFNNFAGEFVPNSTNAVAGELYIYKGVLYKAKEDYNGDWDSSKFEVKSVSTLLRESQNITHLTPVYQIPGRCINSLGGIGSTSTHSIFEFSITEGEQIYFTTITGSYYIAFYTDADVLVGSAFHGSSTLTQPVFFSVIVPTGASKIKISSIVSYVPLVWVIGGKGEFSKLKDSFSSNVAPSDILYGKYLSSLGTIASNASYNLFVYPVKENSIIKFATLTANTRIGFFDNSGAIIGSPFASSTVESVTYYTLKVPVGAVEIKITSKVSFTPTLLCSDGFGDVKNYYDSTFKALNKLPASVKVPVARSSKNLFSNDLVGNFSIILDTGLLNPVNNFPVYKGAAIPVTPGTYTISGYEDYQEWAIGIWAPNYSERLAVKTPDIVDDPNSLISIPEGSSWGSAETIAISIPKDAVIVINLKNWETLHSVAKLQVESGPSKTSYVEGVKLLPYYVTEKELNENLLGKKLLVIGDSLTQLDTYTKALEDNYGCYIYNRGVSGTTVAVRSGHSSSFCERFNLTENNTKGPNSKGFPARSNVDAIIVWGGINDWGNSVPMGSIDGIVDEETFFGAYKYLIDGLKTRYYGKPIIVCSVHNSARSTRFLNWDRVTFNNDGSFTFRTNSQNKYLSDYWDAQKQICDIFGVKFANMFECGVSFMSQYDLEHYSYVQGDPAAPDGLHFNDAGGEIVARYLSSIIADALV